MTLMTNYRKNVNTRHAATHNVIRLHDCSSCCGVTQVFDIISLKEFGLRIWLLQRVIQIRKLHWQRLLMLIHVISLHVKNVGLPSLSSLHSSRNDICLLFATWHWCDEVFAQVAQSVNYRLLIVLWIFLINLLTEFSDYCLNSISAS